VLEWVSGAHRKQKSTSYDSRSPGAGALAPYVAQNATHTAATLAGAGGIIAVDTKIVSLN